MRYTPFMEKRIDPFIRLTLTDLARTLASDSRVDVDFGYHSYYDNVNRKVVVAFFWDRLLDARKWDGMKSDVYLRAFSEPRFCDRDELERAVRLAENHPQPSLFKQLVSVMEEFRWMALAESVRPGMKDIFQSRKALLLRFYRDRYHAHLDRTEWANALFCTFFLRLSGRPVRLTGRLSPLASPLRELGGMMASVQSTKDVVRQVERFLQKLPEGFEDMTELYYPIRVSSEPVLRKEKNESTAHLNADSEEKPNQDPESHDETMPTWHQARKQEDGSFLQFDLEEGKRTDMLGEGGRKMEAGDQALALVQGEGRAQENDRNRYEDAMNGKETRLPDTRSGSSKVRHGINKNVTLREAVIQKPSIKDQAEYAKMRAIIEPAARSFKRTLEKWLERKQSAPRTHLHFGRLGQNLTHLYTDDFPRLFYKKQGESKAFDAAFSLLVDCSASMHDKMDAVRLGVTLFHESLKALNIPHAVTGFWEDALSANDKEQPNFFQRLIRFEEAFLPSVGPRILQLEPQEDNRDGLAIRHEADCLRRRSERHKWLIVFTDGEPSAFGYTEKGLLDTHEAVRMARKKGVHVVGVFLSGEDAEIQEISAMKEIYGRERLIVPTVSEIPFHITPLLRKLIIRSQ
jgi:nitric oxide reductase activation protein